MITRTQVKPYEVRYIAYENFKKKKPKKTSVIDHKAYQFYKKKAKYGSRDNVAHYVDTVLKGNTVLSYMNGKLVSAPYTAV